jgi:PleD family two-component response regulator
VRDLLRGADAAMYLAKLHKRERVHWWRFAGTAV